jgi:hypothetical protein
MNSADVTSLTADSIVTYRLFAKLRDRMRLDQVEVHLAGIPPERRNGVAKRALALHLQRRTRQGQPADLATVQPKSSGVPEQSAT